MIITDFDYRDIANSEIVIYGTTVGGKVIFQCLKERGIKVSFFCDRNGKNNTFCGIPVYNPEVLKQRKEYKVLIALTRSFNSACQYLEELEYEQVYKCCRLIAEKKVEDFVYEENEETAVIDFLNKYSTYANGMKDEEIVLPTLEIFITERCTLRCRDCSHLIPRYSNPKDHCLEEIIEDLKNVLKIVRKISDLTILGGEPLLHKGISKLLEYCYEQEKIEEITIISNGTVLPSEEIFNTMKRTKSRLRLSNYGKYSVHLDDIKTICAEKGITCFINDELWTDMGKIFNHNYSRDELIELFIDCPFAFDLLLLKGKIFRCAHVAHLNSLDIIDSYSHDSVDVRIVNKDNLEDKRRELFEYLNMSYLIGCNYCNGIKNSIQGIEPAIQGVR